MTIEQIQKTLEFYARHQELIDSRIHDTLKSFEPVREDLGNPIIWKSEHWKWFIETYKEKNHV